MLGREGIKYFSQIIYFLIYIKCLDRVNKKINITSYNHIFPKFLKTFRLDFLVFKLDFEETKLGFSNCKFPSILGLTFQLLKRSRNPSKSKFSSKLWKFWKFSTLKNHGFNINDKNICHYDALGFLRKPITKFTNLTRLYQKWKY